MKIFVRLSGCFCRLTFHGISQIHYNFSYFHTQLEWIFGLVFPWNRPPCWNHGAVSMTIHHLLFRSFHTSAMRWLTFGNNKLNRFFSLLGGIRSTVSHFHIYTVAIPYISNVLKVMNKLGSFYAYFSPKNGEYISKMALVIAVRRTRVKWRLNNGSILTYSVSLMRGKF